MNLSLSLSLPSANLSFLAGIPSNFRDSVVFSDFGKGKSYQSGTEVGFSDLYTFTRASTATYFDANGVLQTAAVDEPRFDHDPVTGEALGVLVEESATNLLLNSASLSGQTVSVSSGDYTLSFYGTGSVTLSGAYSGSLSGSGDFPHRSYVTFTATAGQLTLSVSGDVDLAQLETGQLPTSYIPTNGTSVTRAADSLSIDGTKMSELLGGSMPDAVSLYMRGDMNYADTDSSAEVYFLYWVSSGPDDRIDSYLRTMIGGGTSVLRQRVTGQGSESASPTNTYAPSRNTPFAISGRLNGTTMQGVYEGVPASEPAVGGFPDLSSADVVLGRSGNLHVSQFALFSKDVGEASLVEITS